MTDSLILEQTVTSSSGVIRGQEWIDTVIVGTLVVPGQSIGVASTIDGFGGVDGVLG